MLKNKVIKITIITFVVLIAMWFATPASYTKGLFSHTGNSLSINTETKLQTSDLEEEYKKPVYFNIFKFVNNFIPVKRGE